MGPHWGPKRGPVNQNYRLAWLVWNSRMRTSLTEVIWPGAVCPQCLHHQQLLKGTSHESWYLQTSEVICTEDVCPQCLHHQQLLKDASHETWYLQTSRQHCLSLISLSFQLRLSVQRPSVHKCLDVWTSGRLDVWTSGKWTFCNWTFCNWTSSNWTFCGCTVPSTVVKASVSRELLSSNK